MVENAIQARTVASRNEHERFGVRAAVEDWEVCRRAVEAHGGRLREP
jgi:hypothetical protein